MTAKIVVVFKWNGPWFFINLLRLRGSILFVRYWTICDTLKLRKLNDKKRTRIRENETDNVKYSKRTEENFIWTGKILYYTMFHLHYTPVQFDIYNNDFEWGFFCPFSCCLFGIGVDCALSSVAVSVVLADGTFAFIQYPPHFNI